MGGFWHGAISTKNVGALHREKSMGQSRPGGCRKREAGRHTMQVATGVATFVKKELELVKSSSGLSFNAFLHASGITLRRKIRHLGKLQGRISERW